MLQSAWSAPLYTREWLGFNGLSFTAKTFLLHLYTLQTAGFLLILWLFLSVVFISDALVQEPAALIFHLTWYMCQREPPETSDRLRGLCITGISTCSVCLAAVFIGVCKGPFLNEILKKHQIQTAARRLCAKYSYAVRVIVIKSHLLLFWKQ